LKLIGDYENSNFLFVEKNIVEEKKLSNKNRSKVYTGLSRVSVVIFSLLAIILLSIVMTDGGIEVNKKPLWFASVLIFCFVLHMLTIWIIDGFTNDVNKDE